MDQYIVFDLEWNQCPDGKECASSDFPFEIIEIGAVKLDGEFRQTEEFHRLIKPKVFTEIHEKISEVTHVSTEELFEEGEDFEDAVGEFFAWCGENPVFCTWGSMDLTELQRNMAHFGIEIPFPKPLLYYDVQKLYFLWKGSKGDRQSLDTAVKELSVPTDRPFHRALDDAYYTGRIMAAMDMDAVKEYRSVDYYRLPQTKEEEIYLVFPDYAKYVSRPFDTKEDAMEDKDVTDLICCRCNRMLRKRIRWFSVNQRYFFALGVCPEHGFVRGKIRLKHTAEGRIYVVKTMKLVDENGARLVEDKKEGTKQRRIERMRQKKLKKN